MTITLAPDKKLHFYVGMSIGLAAARIHLGLAVPAALAGGIMREIYNKLTGGKFDWMDVLWTVTGGVAGLLIALGADLFLIKLWANKL